MYRLMGDNMKPDNPYQIKLDIDKEDVIDYKENKIEEYTRKEVKEMLISEILLNQRIYRENTTGPKMNKEAVNY